MIPSSSPFRYNLVILPTEPIGSPERMFQLSANCPGHQRMVSPAWNQAQVRAALQTASLPDSQVEALFQGNRMVFGGRDSRYLHFDETTLTRMGLSPV